MKAIYKSVPMNGRLYQHLPISNRPCSCSVEVYDDDGSVFLFKSNDDQTVSARDWYDAQINGRRYTNNSAWSADPVGFLHDKPEPAEPISVFFAYGDEPTADDVLHIAEVIQRVTMEPVHFRRNETVTIVI